MAEQEGVWREGRLVSCSKGEEWGARDKGGLKDEGVLERTVPLWALRGGLGTWTGAWLSSSTGVCGRAGRPSRLHPGVSETPEKLLSSGGSCIQPCHMHTSLSLWHLQTTQLTGRKLAKNHQGHD